MPICINDSHLVIAGNCLKIYIHPQSLRVFVFTKDWLTPKKALHRERYMEKRHGTGGYPLYRAGPGHNISKINKFKR